MRYSDNERRMNFLRRKAKEVRDYRVTMKILATCLACIASLVAVLYVSAALYEKTGAFTVSINKAEHQKYGLSLFSEYDSMDKRGRVRGTSHLDMNINENMTNIDGSTIPENIDDIDGEHNGEDYVAYTFYVQNTGEETVSYEYALKMTNASNGLDEAIRVKVYVNGKPTTYAKAPNSELEVEADADKNFRSGTDVMRTAVNDFEVGEYTKFTVVVWIEGNDPECLDWVLGGQLKFEMVMKVLDAEAQ